MNSPRRSAALFVAFLVATMLLVLAVIGWQPPPLCTELPAEPRP
jgi:hypothetical protein